MILYKKKEFLFIITDIHKNQGNKNTNDHPKKM